MNEELRKQMAADHHLLDSSIKSARKDAKERLQEVMGPALVHRTALRCPIGAQLNIFCVFAAGDKVGLQDSQRKGGA